MNPDDQLMFRQATADDSPAIRAIFTDALAAYQIDLPDNYSFDDIDDIQGAYLNAHGAFMVLTRAQHVIGFFGLSPLGARRVQLKRLYLHPAQRGRGLGNRLMSEALGRARQMGFSAMHLETTSKFKEAVGMYEKHGFTNDHDAVPSQGHDIALMKVL